MSEFLQTKGNPWGYTQRGVGADVSQPLGGRRGGPFAEPVPPPRHCLESQRPGLANHLRPKKAAGVGTALLAIVSEQ